MSLSETAGRITNLTDEERACLETCARLCRDVADITATHARFMERDSNYSPELPRIDAGVCEECAEECERHDAEHCQVCADLRECAESCRNLLAS